MAGRDISTFIRLSSQAAILNVLQVQEPPVGQHAAGRGQAASAACGRRRTGAGAHSRNLAPTRAYSSDNLAQPADPFKLRSLCNAEPSMRSCQVEYRGRGARTQLGKNGSDSDPEAGLGSSSESSHDRRPGPRRRGRRPLLSYPADFSTNSAPSLFSSPCPPLASGCQPPRPGHAAVPRLGCRAGPGLQRRLG
jgi:hypothetical protein